MTVPSTQPVPLNPRWCLAHLDQRLPTRSNGFSAIGEAGIPPERKQEGARSSMPHPSTPVLIDGRAGYIGSVLSKQVLERGCRVTVLIVVRHDLWK